MALPGATMQEMRCSFSPRWSGGENFSESFTCASAATLCSPAASRLGFREAQAWILISALLPDCQRTPRYSFAFYSPPTLGHVSVSVSGIVKRCVLPERGTRDALQNVAFILPTKCLRLS